MLAVGTNPHITPARRACSSRCSWSAAFSAQFSVEVEERNERLRFAYCSVLVREMLQVLYPNVSEFGRAKRGRRAEPLVGPGSSAAPLACELRVRVRALVVRLASSIVQSQSSCPSVLVWPLVPNCQTPSRIRPRCLRLELHVQSFFDLFREDKRERLNFVVHSAES